MTKGITEETMGKQQEGSGMARNRRTMKRRRPWDRTTKVATITMLLLSSLWAPSACAEENLFRQNKPTKSPRPSSPDITKDFAPFVFSMRLNVTDAVDFNDLLPQLNTNIEAYMFEELARYGSFVDYLTIRAVTLSVRRLVRRRIQQQLDFLRRRLQESTQIVIVEVDGATHYEVDVSQSTLASVKSQVLQEVDALLTVNAVGNSVVDSDTVENVVGVNEVSLNLAIEDDDDDDDLVGSGATTTDNKIKKPSTLEMVVGFTLLGLMVVSWIFYIYLFWKKRQKRLARKNRPQAKPNVPQNLKPARKQTNPQPSNGQLTTAKQDTNFMKSLPTTSSDDSSFKGDTNGPLFEETNPFADSFTKELDAASKRDEEAWEKLRQKQSTFDGNFVDMNGKDKNEKKTTDVMPFTPYSPYGDGAQDGIDFSLDDISNWEPYGISSGKTEEKKEDAWGTASAFSVGSSGFSDAFGMDLSQMGGSVNADRLEQSSVAGSEASSMMLEVQKLSKYVQRYEKRKERKVKREKDRESRSSEGSGPDMNYLQNLKMSVDQRRRDKKGNGHVSFLDASSNANSSASGNTSLKEAGANLTSQLLNKSRSPPTAKRSGFSPFQEDFKFETVMEVDEEHEVEEETKLRASFPIDTSTEPARPRSRSLGDRPQYKNTFYTSTANSATLRKYKAATESKRKRLEALRSNTAIIDSSKSDVNVGGFSPTDTPAAFSTVPTAKFAARPTPAPTPGPRPTTNVPAQQPTTRLKANSNSKLANRISMFEQKSNSEFSGAPIFPTGQFF